MAEFTMGLAQPVERQRIVDLAEQIQGVSKFQGYTPLELWTTCLFLLTVLVEKDHQEASWERAEAVMQDVAQRVLLWGAGTGGGVN